VRTLRVAFVAIGIVYPFIVYFGLQKVTPSTLAVGLIALLAVRLAYDFRKGNRDFLPSLAACLVVLIVVARSPLLGLKAYPIVLSLGFAAVFGYSLLAPPTIVERIARIRHPHLPPDANPYLRKITITWFAFFIINAAISAATATNGSVKLWTLYNGFLSYIAMGAIFAGELLIRQRVHQRLFGGTA
jgi:uncharacterized membrane protein